MPRHSIVSKFCSKCSTDKSPDEFGVESRRPDGLCLYCKLCQNAYTRNYRKTHEQYRVKQGRRKNRHKRKHTLKYLYKITPQDYEKMFANQGGCCAICCTDRPGGRHGQLHVDHDHVTGIVRGLLCNRCNIGLGRFGDNLAGLMQAVNYLRRAAGASPLP